MNAIEGVRFIEHDHFEDERGSFVKLYRTDQNIVPVPPEGFSECYYTISRRGVLRGMHFQRPPHDHQKLVTCLSGKAFDCVLDLRRTSKTFGKAQHFHLAPGVSVFIPKGCAHGFYAEQDETLLLYQVTSPYSPDDDDGVHWTSASVPWPSADPILSDRDKTHPHLSEYDSPFD